jgi:hypothetical protein
MIAGAKNVHDEVLSPTTRDFETIGKPDEYKTIDTLERLRAIEPIAPEIMSRSAEPIAAGAKTFAGTRSGGGHTRDRATLSVAEICDGVNFPVQSRLVADDPEPSRRFKVKRGATANNTLLSDTS